MNVGQIYLEKAAATTADSFAAIIEALDRLAIDQHVLVADIALARSLQALPYVTVGPVVRSPVMAYCLMPEVDIVHIHDEKSYQAGLLLTLTRSLPYVLTAENPAPATRNPLKRSVFRRAQAVLHPENLAPEKLVETYRRSVDGWLKLPQDANSG